MHDVPASDWINTQPESVQTAVAGSESGEERRDNNREGGRERKSRDMYGRDRRNNRDGRARNDDAAPRPSKARPLWLLRPLCKLRQQHLQWQQ